MPAFPIERAKVHRELPVLISPVTHAEDHHIALVTLDVLKVLDEESVKSILGKKRIEFGGSLPSPVQGNLNGSRLRLRECDHANGDIFLRGAETRASPMHHAVDHHLCFTRIIPGGAPSIHAIFHVEEPDTEIL